MLRAYIHFATMLVVVGTNTHSETTSVQFYGKSVSITAVTTGDDHNFPRGRDDLVGCQRDDFEGEVVRHDDHDGAEREEMGQVPQAGYCVAGRE